MNKSPVVASFSQSHRNVPVPPDPTLVLTSKNFAKTTQLLLNEITAHKLAGIFAKPLSERDAPGYKDLVFRPQDLKSIKAAVSKGSRAATAAIEEFEARTAGNDDRMPTSRPPVTVSSEVSIGNGFYFINKTEELYPPKGIVNSSQLEMELVRMFANAVMFNPLPSNERGFGRSLRLRRRGGDVVPDLDVDASERGSSEETSSPDAEEGGIISDAREMFNDVLQMVSKWRELEAERMTAIASAGGNSNLATPAPVDSLDVSGGGAGGGNSTARHTSVSASSALGHGDEDEVGGGEATPSAAASVSGNTRKRRRVGDH